jgi:uncharacterized membrane protein (DUF4010 family)
VLVAGQAVSLSLDASVVRLVLAGALGMFLGLEREWSHKTAGIRTFSLASLGAAAFTVLGLENLLVVGGVLVVVQGLILGVDGLLSSEGSLSLTTSMSLLVAYGVGALVASGYIVAGVTVTVVSSLLLVLKRELHSFAWGLTREELRSAAEFAILAFVIYPVLPRGEMSVGYGGFMLAFEPRIVWLLVVTVAGIGIVNYAIVQSYGGRGIAVTGFFGGIASSTAVVGTMLDHVRQRPQAASYAVAAILLADAAMALRNLFIALAFTFETGILVGAVVPLGTVAIGSVVVAGLTADWRESVDIDLTSPFSLRRALAFGAIFLVVVVTSSLAQQQFGTGAFYLTSAASGLVSSASATTSAVLLYRAGDIPASQAVVAILLATGASILVKAGLTVTSPNRKFASRVAILSGALLAGATAVTILITL